MREVYIAEARLILSKGGFLSHRSWKPNETISLESRGYVVNQNGDFLSFSLTQYLYTYSKDVRFLVAKEPTVTV